MLQQLIEQISAAWKMEEALVPNAEGLYSLGFEPGLEVIIGEKNSEEIFFFTSLAPLPKKNREEWLIKLMAANLFGRETGGSILGIDREGKKVTLSQWVDEELSFKEFYEFLEDFVNYADVWRQELMTDQLEKE